MGRLIISIVNDVDLKQVVKQLFCIAPIGGHFYLFILLIVVLIVEKTPVPKLLSYLFDE